MQRCGVFVGAEPHEQADDVTQVQPLLRPVAANALIARSSARSTSSAIMGCGRDCLGRVRSAIMRAARWQERARRGFGPAPRRSDSAAA